MFCTELIEDDIITHKTIFFFNSTVEFPKTASSWNHGQGMKPCVIALAISGHSRDKIVRPLPPQLGFLLILKARTQHLILQRHLSRNRDPALRAFN
jgi:hypothetical protein